MLPRGVIFLLLCISITQALNNGLARTPPMGWNSWNHFGCNTTELTQDLFMDTAYAMVKSGMKDAGYEYINMDDCWLAKTRDANGTLQPDPTRFPDGIAALASYIHSLGLKFGIYEDTGNMTCGGYPGSEGHYAQDAKTYAEWGVDYVKLDGCYTVISDMHEIYTTYSNLLNDTGRPMVFSCSWPAYQNLETNQTANYTYMSSICNLWRYYFDVTDSFDSWTGILDYTENQTLYPFAGPGHWNDPDMLEIGNGNQTSDEYRSLMSIWSIVAAPLIAGNDLRQMSRETIEILTAPEVIAVDQDPLGKQGYRINQTGLSEIWLRELHDGALAVALFNRGTDDAEITVHWDEIGLLNNQRALVRDLWRRTDLGRYTSYFTSHVVSHGTVLVKITPLHD